LDRSGVASLKKLWNQKSPSRTRYEERNPILGIRLPKEYHEKVKSYGERRCDFLSRYLKQCVDIEEDVICLSIETLRKAFKLSPDKLRNLYERCGIDLKREYVGKSFFDFGFGYLVNTKLGLKLNLAICLAYLFLHEYCWLPIDAIANYVGDPLDNAVERIRVARSELARIFYWALVNCEKDLMQKHSFIVTDILG